MTTNFQNKFHEGDKVCVKSSCGSTDKTGVVIKYILYPEKYNRKYVQIKLTGGHTQSYNENSLTLVS